MTRRTVIKISRRRRARDIMIDRVCGLVLAAVGTFVIVYLIATGV